MIPIPRKIAFLTFLLLVTTALAVQPAARQEQQASPPPTPHAAAPPETAAAAAKTELPPTRDPVEIVRRAITADEDNVKKERDYTYQERRIVKRVDGHGNAKSQETTTYDISAYYGEPFERLIAKNDKPLSAGEQQKEDKKLDKFLAQRKNESEGDRRKRLAKEEKAREKERAFDKDVINAYDFRLLPDEQIDGRKMYVIEAAPRKGFHPTQPHADILSKLKGKVWVDQKDYGWAKIDVEAVDTISFGLFLVRLHKGSQIHIEQTRVNHEVWLLKRLSMNASARLLLFKNAAFGMESAYSNYKKFTTTSRMLPGVKEAPAGTPK